MYWTESAGPKAYWRALSKLWRHAGIAGSALLAATFLTFAPGAAAYSSTPNAQNLWALEGACPIAGLGCDGSLFVSSPGEATSLINGRNCVYAGTYCSVTDFPGVYDCYPDECGYLYVSCIIKKQGYFIATALIIRTRLLFAGMPQLSSSVQASPNLVKQRSDKCAQVGHMSLPAEAALRRRNPPSLSGI